ncbi:hypothetical protein ACROYT_G034194 [Oculina patagonica]
MAFLAELGELGELMGETEEGIEAEGAEAGEAEAGEAEAEGSAETAAEAEKAAESTSMLRRCVDALKKINWSVATREFVVFVGKNAAIGGILYGVNVVLQKMFGHGGGGGGANQQKIQQKQKKVKALAQLTSDLTDALTKLANWTKEKEEVTVDAGEGITVPLPDILSKFTKPMGKDVEEAFNVAKQLQKKDGDAKPTFVVPTTEQVDQLINSSESILHALQDIITFVDAKKEKFSGLGTFPIERNDVDKINADVWSIKRMPYA